jgi:hypothetical protein
MRKEYKVMRPFPATAPISGAQRAFQPGEIVVCDKAENGPTLTIEADDGAFSNYFLVDRSVFEASCKWISRGPGI